MTPCCRQRKSTPDSRCRTPSRTKGSLSGSLFDIVWASFCFLEFELRNLFLIFTTYLDQEFCWSMMKFRKVLVVFGTKSPSDACNSYSRMGLLSVRSRRKMRENGPILEAEAYNTRQRLAAINANGAWNRRNLCDKIRLAEIPVSFTETTHFLLWLERVELNV